MATRAQSFRAAEQRKRHEAPKVRKPRRIIDPNHTETRHPTKRAAKNPNVALEDSMNGRPSRKSTRASVHGGRPDELIMRTARGKSLTPKARALRAQVERR